MTRPLLSIIIISFNTAKLLKACLQSIRTDKGLEFKLDPKSQKFLTEIIVIDNASTDQSRKILKKIPYIKFIANSKNIGFAKANNQGLKIATGQYILLLNPDTLILHSAISQSINWLSSHPEAHLCTASLHNPDKSIQPSGGFFPNLLNVFTWSTGLDDLPFVNRLIPAYHPHSPDFYTKDNFYQTDHEQDWVTGAFMLFRKSVYDLVGGFDENYFMYGEEVEYCYRQHQKLPDSKVYYLIGPEIIHYGQASVLTKVNPIIQEYQGVLSFFKIHRPIWQYQLVRLLLKLNCYLRGLINPIYKQAQNLI